MSEYHKNVQKMIYPNKEKYGLDCSCVYLIESVDEDNFIVFRALPEEEFQSRKDTDDWIIKYENDPYLYLSNLPSYELAEVAVKSYWKAIDELVTKFDYKRSDNQND
ncbi:hypothetical protein [Oceanobacillus timonensis]|uniref:hypothetical protein n=1 Tax=Oceanobacillus timonensis TaxID=1926285 RepID=UPI0009BC5B9A|nr:hypothetical protein [Oceanobacillus timonensis]